jgi:endonuclease III
MSESAAQKALREITRAFVDWNDLRVSRVEEVAEVLGRDAVACRATALALTAALRGVFDEHHKISLATLKKLGKRPARQDLEKIEGVSRFVINYCLLTSLEAHAIPLTEQMTEYLKRNGIIDANADAEDLEGFLTRCVAAKDAYEFYVLLRRESESPKVPEDERPSRPAQGQKRAAQGVARRMHDEDGTGSTQWIWCTRNKCGFRTNTEIRPSRRELAESDGGAV